MKRTISLFLVLVMVICLCPTLSAPAIAASGSDYVLTLDANGGRIGSLSGQSKKTITISRQQQYYDYVAGQECSAARNKGYRAGYKFLGWFTAKTGGTQVKTGVKFTGATVYAHWELLPTYKVTYKNMEGATNVPANQTKYTDVNLTLTNKWAQKTGYTLEGYATSLGGAVGYKPGSTYKANKSLTLYAVWKANTYTVSYNLEGGVLSNGSTTIPDQKKTHGVTLTLSKETPIKSGYTFAGWAEGSNTVARYAPSGQYTNNYAIVLHAIWTPIPVRRVGYDGYGAPAENTVLDGTTITLPNPTLTYEGHEFAGWGTGNAVYKPGEAYTVKSDVRFSANWNHTTHIYAEDTSNSQDGIRRMKCKYCPDYYDEVIRCQGEHHMVERQVSECKWVFECSVCHMSYTVGHHVGGTFVKKEGEGDCESGTLRACRRCNRCGEEYWKVCLEHHYVGLYCDVCGKRKTSDFLFVAGAEVGASCDLVQSVDYLAKDVNDAGLLLDAKCRYPESAGSVDEDIQNTRFFLFNGHGFDDQTIAISEWHSRGNNGAGTGDLSATWVNNQMNFSTLNFASLICCYSAGFCDRCESIPNQEDTEYYSMDEASETLAYAFCNKGTAVAIGCNVKIDNSIVDEWNRRVVWNYLEWLKSVSSEELTNEDYFNLAKMTLYNMWRAGKLVYSGFDYIENIIIFKRNDDGTVSGYRYKKESADCIQLYRVKNDRTGKDISVDE